MKRKGKYDSLLPMTKLNCITCKISYKILAEMHLFVPVSAWGSISLVSAYHVSTLMCCSVRMLKQRCALGCMMLAVAGVWVPGSSFQVSHCSVVLFFSFWLYLSHLSCCPFCSTFPKSASAQKTVGTACATAEI